MSSIKTVAIAGATGSMGTPLVKELVKSGFTVTALTRSDSNNFPPEVKVQKVDYNDLSSLKEALKSQDAVVSTITTAGIESQTNLIDAAIAARVKRFIPSEFGCDLNNPKARQLPVYGQKVQIQEALEKKVQGTETTYTYIYNNAFLDWGMDMYGFLIDIKNKKMQIFDDGNTPFTTTPIPMVAKAVAAVLMNPEETRNTDIRVHGVKLTQNKFLDMAKKIIGEDGWTVTRASTQDLESQAYESLKKDPSNFMAWGIPMLYVAIFGPGYGGDLSANNDNKRLGLQELNDADVEAMIKERA